MTEDELMGLRNSIIKGLKEEHIHDKPSQETDRRLSVMETNFTNINEDLKDIKTAINRSTIWLIITLFSILFSASSVAFWIGSWKGSFETRLDTIYSRITVNEERIEKMREQGH